MSSTYAASTAIRARSLWVLVTTLGLLLAAAVVAAPAYADTDQWSGGGDGHSWTDASNWVSNTVPQAGDDVTIQQSGLTVDDVPAIELNSLTVGGSDLTLNGGGTLTIASGLSWSGGTINASLVLLGGDSTIGALADSTPKTLGQGYDITVKPGATLSLTSDSAPGAITLWEGDKLTVDKGATLESDGNNEITYTACCVDPAVVVNNGTLELASGTFQSTRLDLNGIELDQNGTVDTGGGALTVEAPAKLTTGTFTGGGTVDFTSDDTRHQDGTQTVDTGTTVAQDNGDMFGDATITGAGTWQLSGGALDGTTTVAKAGRMLVTGTGTSTLANYDGKTQVGHIVNHGSLTLGQTTLDIDPPASITNAADGSFDLTPGSDVTTDSCCAAPAQIVNHGTVDVPAVAGSGAPTTATVDGVSYISDAATHVSAGQTLALVEAPSQLSSPAALTGPGAVTDAGPMTVTGAITMANGSAYRLLHGAAVTGDGGTLAPAASADTASVEWQSGSVGGHLTLAKGVDLTVDGTDTKQISQPASGQSVLTTEGPTTIAAGSDANDPDTVSIWAGQVWRNAGTMTLPGFTRFTSEACCVAPAQLDNVKGGSIAVSPAAGTTTVFDSAELHNDGGRIDVASGTLRTGDTGLVSAAGTTTVAAGATLGESGTGDAAEHLAGGTLAGDGTVALPIDNTGGTVTPGGSEIGTLTAAGGYTQGPGGHLDVQLGTKSADRLAVTGTASIAGVLIGSTSGSKPAAGSNHAVLTAGTITGRFDCVLSAGAGKRQWRAAYKPGAVQLVAKSKAPTGCDTFTPAPVKPLGKPVTVKSGKAVSITVAKHAGVPAKAAAVLLDVAATGASKTATLRVDPAGKSAAATTPLALRKGVSSAVTVPVRLGHGGKVSLRLSAGKAKVTVGVEGWYVDEQAASGGDLYHPLAPTAIGKPMSVKAGAAAALRVAGAAGVPGSGATAVTVEVEIDKPTAAAALSVTAAGATAGKVPAQWVTAGKPSVALVTVPLPSGGTHKGKLAVHLSKGKATAQVTVVGYDTARSGGGSYFIPVPGADAGSAYVTDSSGDVDLAGRAGIPASGGTAVATTESVTQATKPAILSAGTWLQQLAPVAGVPTRGSGAAVVTPDPSGYEGLQLSKGTATVDTDVFGYYAG